jgi:hypothetical protein
MTFSDSSASAASSGLFILVILATSAFQKRKTNRQDDEDDVVWVIQNKNSHEENSNLLRLAEQSRSSKSINRSTSLTSCRSDISLGLSFSKSTDDFLKELGPLCISPKIDKIMKSIQSTEAQIGGAITIMLSAAGIAFISLQTRANNPPR